MTVISVWMLDEGDDSKLLELTHSMWIHRNLVVHDSVTGTHALRRKEALQLEVERQIE